MKVIFYVICKCAAERKNMNSTTLIFFLQSKYFWKNTDVKPIFIDVHLALNYCWKWHIIQMLLIDKSKTITEIDFGLQF